MNTLGFSFLRHIIVYHGLGPYPDNIPKQIEMFCGLNEYRKRDGRPPWKVTSVAGENLISVLEASNPKETLLVIPAGRSSDLEAALSSEQIAYIQQQFLHLQGGRLYAVCGAGYMVSKIRKYNALGVIYPEKRDFCVKPSRFPLFEGKAKGPLCPYPGEKHNVSFSSHAISVTNGKENCAMYLSGGGSFFLGKSSQEVQVLVKYSDEGLLRLGKPPQQYEKWSNAAILAKVGNGAILLSMFHPDCGPEDIDVNTYIKAFPHCGTNWRAVKENLSPLDQRMKFVLSAMLYPLEDLH
jgi:glutamine amidotransferase-like uncharacterized protein